VVRVQIKFPLETERLAIRPLREEDASALHEVWSDPETMRYIPAEPAATVDETEARVRRHVERHEATGLALWAVEERDTGEVIGVCGLFPVEGTGPEVEVAYHIARRHWGRGIATEAARACVDAGLAAGLEQVVAFAYPANGASIRVMEKAGLRPDGRVQIYGRELVRYTTVDFEGEGTKIYE
jgi:ribosomal-protein-alanine N-acetyltransferase